MTQKKYTYEGVLMLYGEQGIGNSAILQNDQIGKGRYKNNSWTPGDPKNGPEYYYSLNYSHWFNKKYDDEIEIYAKDGSVLYSGPLTFDREKSRNHYYIFVPKEIPYETWISYLYQELRARVYTNNKSMPE